MDGANLDIEAISAGGKILSKSELASANQTNIINEVFQMIRDARSEENARALQDSESNTAIEQKRMINGLVRKGWSKNEVVSEIQRVWGQDVVILPNMLDDNRGHMAKYGIKMVIGFMMMTPFVFRFFKMGGYK